MLWTFFTVLTAAWTARIVQGTGAFTAANLGFAFVLGVAAGSAVALGWGLVAYNFVDAAPGAERRFLLTLRRGPLVAALGAIAGLVHVWGYAQRRKWREKRDGG